MSDKEAFTSMIQDNAPIIFKISALYTKNEDDRKDLYQEIVLQLWKAFDQFRHEAKISTWIYRIALNTAITQFRKVKKQAAHISIDQLALPYTESADAAFEDRLTAMYQFIDKLNDLDKGIIILFLEGKSYEEMAAVLGLTVTNIATRLSRIKLRLKSQLLTTKL